MYFTKKMSANYYDCGADNRLKISAAMRYMQQTSSEHLESIDLSPVRLFNEHMVFLLTKMCVKVHRMPSVAEPLVVGTVATEIRGSRFAREFVVESPSGERLISSLSLWILVDPETRKIMRPSSFPYALPFQASLVEGVIGDMRFPKLPESSSHYKNTIEIRYSHIDTNAHVNNSVYADFICDMLPNSKLLESGLDTLVIGFNSEAKHGDLVDMTADALTDKEYYINGRHGGVLCFESLAILK